MKRWMWKSSGHQLIGDAFRVRAGAISYAVERCMSIDDYRRLGNDAARWRLAYRKGHRIVRVEVSEVAQ